MRRNRVTKPAGSARIDWTHPLARGLQAAWLLNIEDPRIANEATRQIAYDAVARLRLTATILVPNSATVGFRPGPTGFGFTGSLIAPGVGEDPGLASDVNASPNIAPATNVSLFWRGAFLGDCSGVTPGIALMSAPSAGGGRAYGLLRTTGDQTGIYIVDSAGGANNFVLTAGVIETTKYGKPVALGYSHDAGISKGYKDGIRFNTLSAAGALAYGASPQITVGYETQTSGTAATFTDVLYIWNRTLSDFEQAYLAQHPYEFLITPTLLMAYGPPPVVPPIPWGEDETPTRHWLARAGAHQVATRPEYERIVPVAPPPLPLSADYFLPTSAWLDARIRHYRAATADIEIPVPPVNFTQLKWIPEPQLPESHWGRLRGALHSALQAPPGGEFAKQLPIIVPDPAARIFAQLVETPRVRPPQFDVAAGIHYERLPVTAGSRIITVTGIPSQFAAGVPAVKGPLQVIFARSINAGAIGFPALVGGDPSLSVRINGIERNLYVKRTTVKVDRQLSGRATCNFTMEVNTAGYVPSPDDQIVIHEAGVRWFAGTIDTVEGMLQPSTAANYEYAVTCVDKNIMCDRRLVFQQYGIPAQPQAPGVGGVIENDMIRDVVANFLSGEGVTTNNVGSGSVILGAQLVYQGKTVTEVFNNISALTGDQWYIDFFNDLHFGPVALAPVFSSRPGGYSLITDNLRYRNLKVKRTRSKYRNVQYVRSDKFLVVSTRAETFTVPSGAGQTNFITNFPITSAPVIKVNGVVQSPVNELYSTPGAAGLGWFYILNGSGVFNVASPPSVGATVEVDYNSFLSNVVMALDPAGIAARKAAAGGSGRFEALEEVKGADVGDATYIAQGLLRKYGQGATFPTTITYQNDYPPPDPGMLIAVNLPEYGINANFLVQLVKSVSQGAPLAQGTSFRSDITLVSTEDQGSGITWFENLLSRTKQGSPSVTYEEATFILGPGGGLTTGNNGANPYIVKQSCQIAEIKIIAGVAPSGDRFRCDILRSVAGLSSPTSIFAPGRYAEIPVGSTNLITMAPSGNLANIPTLLNKDDVLTPNVLLANGSGITLVIIMAIRGPGALG